MIGETISHYRVETKLGEGGMGVVYRAQDLTLQRSVAIKFLSSEIADEDRRRRFQQEAQTASALNHPHILTVYEVGIFKGRDYLVTEYVEGGSLRERILRGPMPLREVLELAIGIADALACAHAAGIVHRDVKPENILISRDGHAKLVDFGLAKLTVSGDSDPTRTLRMEEVRTRSGVIVGTVPYMSPEQLSGKPADARSDVFAFGAVLYEMLTGRRAFPAATDAELIGEILHRDPRPVAELRPDAPAALRDIVEKAQEKEPADRYQTMKDAVVDLRRVQRRKPVENPAPPPVPARRRMVWAMGAPLALVLAMAAGAWWWMVRSDYFWKNPLENARFEKITDWEGTELDAAISHDGKFVAFLADRDGPYDYWITQVDGGEFRNLTGGRFPTLLHESLRTTGFNADGTQVWLRATQTKVDLEPLLGGPLRPLLMGGNPVWSPDGTRMAFHHPTPGDPLMIADPSGRNEKQIFAGRSGEHGHYLTWSPDQRHIYFVRGFRSTEMDVWRIPSEGGTPERITHHNSHVAYPVMLDNRTLIYRATSGDGAGWALYGMDIERRIPHRISLGVEQYQSIAANADGRRLVASVSNPALNLWKVPITAGTVDESAATRVPLPAAQARGGRYSRGSLLYLSSKGGENGLWRWKDNAAVELWKGTDGAVKEAPSLSPDGDSIALVVRRGGRITLFRMTADGADARALAENLDVRGSPSWSPDAKWIVVSADAGDGPRIYKVPTEGGTPVRLTDQVTFGGVWSPDGQLILYHESPQGATFPLRGIRPDKTPVAVPTMEYRGDFEGYHFLPGGKSLILLQGNFRSQDFWQVDLATGKQRRLTALKPGYSVRSFDVSPDGREILFDRLKENSDIVLIERFGKP